MVDISRQYFCNLWSGGDGTLPLLDDQFVFRHSGWTEKIVVGASQMAKHVRDVRYCYPDLRYEILQIGQSDNNHLFVSFTLTGTNMEVLPKHRQTTVPSYHESHVTGIAIVTFSEDRSKLLEVCEFREPTMEERNEVLANAQPKDPFAINLARLHWEGSDNPRSRKRT